MEELAIKCHKSGGVKRNDETQNVVLELPHFLFLKEARLCFTQELWLKRDILMNINSYTFMRSTTRIG